jgi:hypothetical protein
MKAGDWVRYKLKGGMEFVSIVGSKGQCGVSIAMLRACMKDGTAKILEVRSMQVKR